MRKDRDREVQAKKIGVSCPIQVCVPRYATAILPICLFKKVFIYSLCVLGSGCKLYPCSEILDTLLM